MSDIGNLQVHLFQIVLDALKISLSSYLERIIGSYALWTVPLLS